MEEQGRRGFLGGMATAALGMAAAPVRAAEANVPSKIRLSCNFYTFNEPLQSKTMTLEEALDFCGELGFDAVDLTGYYFPGYPEVPPADYVRETKRRAFRLGLDISGTGVRNDFTVPDPARRAADVTLVKSWVEVAARLGAPALRVFAGREVPGGHGRDEVVGWVVDCLEECVDWGARHGVVIALQNHDDVLRTADEVAAVHDRIASPWLGLNVDIGSLRTADPYEEIARLAPLACTWQIKEQVYRRGVEEKADLPRVFTIMREAGYRGYAPLEILGEGDPRPRLRRFLEEARRALG